MKKKSVTALLAVTLTASLFVGCGNAAESASPEEPAEIVEEVDESKKGTEEEIDKEDTSDVSERDVKKVVGALEMEKADVLENVDYVMIYNPNRYDTDAITREVDDQIRSTGDFSKQIVTGSNRAGDLGFGGVDLGKVNQDDINANVDLSVIERTENRAGGMDPIYSEGDIHDFYYDTEDLSERILGTFECLYEGDYCYVWTTNDYITADDALYLGENFDAYVFEQDTEVFGNGRFTADGGKVNLLCYPMEGGICGFFTTADIFSSEECPEVYAEYYGYNTDHAIININANFFEDDIDLMCSTAAHEYQHNICASDAFYYVDTPYMETWLNEAMSAYAETLTYPELCLEQMLGGNFYLSESFNKGQSLYNFSTKEDPNLGAYGVVYMFSNYLIDLDSDEVLSKIHEFWRESYRDDITEEEALVYALPEDVVEEIDATYLYDKNMSYLFDSDEQMFMSKLALDFYIKALEMGLANLEEYTEQCQELMLYSEINPVDIEGGGRIIVATQNGSFEIPDDADEDLIYIGLDKDFNVVTNMIVK